LEEVDEVRKKGAWLGDGIGDAGLFLVRVSRKRRMLD
jgi:hypothetical protein